MRCCFGGESYGFRIVRTPILCGPNRATFTITGKDLLALDWMPYSYIFLPLEFGLSTHDDGVRGFGHWMR